MDKIFIESQNFIGGGVKQYIGIIADSSEILGRIGDE